MFVFSAILLFFVSYVVMFHNILAVDYRDTGLHCEDTCCFSTNLLHEHADQILSVTSWM